MRRIVAALLGCGLLVAGLAQGSPSSDVLSRAEQLKAAGDKVGALAAYREAVQLEPQSAVAHNELGTAYFEDGQRDLAIAEFQKATLADPSYALAHYNHAFAARQAGRFEEALGAYQRYQKLKPEDADAQYGIAESLRALGRNAEAAAAYEAYAAQETRESEAPWVAKARKLASQLRGGGSTGAAAAATVPPPPTADRSSVPVAAGGAAPSDLEALLARGDSALAEHKSAEATRAYQDAVSRAPDSAVAHFKLGLAYAQFGYLPQAMEQWQAVLKIDPANQPAKDNLERARAKLAANAQVSPAVASPAPAVDAGVGGATPRQSYEQAVALISQRRFAEAASALTSAVAQQPNFAVAYVARGSAYVGLGRFPEAVQDYLQGLALNPNQASPLFGLGEAYRGMGDKPRAAQYYQQCADSTAPDASSLRELARKRYADLLKQ